MMLSQETLGSAWKLRRQFGWRLAHDAHSKRALMATPQCAMALQNGINLETHGLLSSWWFDLCFNLSLA